MATQSATKFERLVLGLDGFAARITLRNPPLNIIDILMMEELSAALGEMESRPEISVIVFSGAGNCFSAGVDVGAHAPDKVASMLEKFHRVIRTLITTSTVVIAELRGRCLGGGAELAMVCDLVYTSDDAQ
jgi:enoyl-CoA hydratase/carnithine racemase